MPEKRIGGAQAIAAVIPGVVSGAASMRRLAGQAVAGISAGPPGGVSRESVTVPKVAGSR